MAAAARPTWRRPPANSVAQQVREHDTGGGEGDVGEAHQQQATIGPVGRLGEPDQRGDGDVVQRRVVGEPDGAIAVVASCRPLDRHCVALSGTAGWRSISGSRKSAISWAYPRWAFSSES